MVRTDLKSVILNFNPIGQGWMGVELFLVISGFLIHFIFLQNQNNFSWPEFFSKRFWRIYPPYLLVLISFFILGIAITFYGFKNLLSHILLTHNFFDSTFFTINPSFWSIALEAQLYLIYPFFLFLVRYHGIKKTLAIIFLFNIVLTIIGLLLQIKSFSYGTFVLKFWIVWCVGAYLADSFYNRRKIFQKPLFWFIGLYVLCFLFKLYYLTNYFILLPITFSCVALIETFLYNEFLEKYLLWKSLNNSLSFIGLISYSIYLIHQPLLNNLFCIYTLKTHHSYFNFLISILFVYLNIFLVSYSLYVLVESKSILYGKNLRKKKRYFL